MAGVALAIGVAGLAWLGGPDHPATAATGATAVTGVGTSATLSASSTPTREQRLAGFINKSRKDNGLHGYRVSATLSAVAEKQARWMASHQSLQHNPSLTSDVKGWVAIGENVAYSYTTKNAHSALMHSPPHRANLLSKSFTQVGVGVVLDSHGRVWVCEVFRRPA